MRLGTGAGLTYGGERHKSLDKKAGGWGELVGFLNQDIKAHLRKRERTCVRGAAGAWQAEAGAESERHCLPRPQVFSVACCHPAPVPPCKASHGPVIPVKQPVREAEGKASDL